MAISVSRNLLKREVILEFYTRDGNGVPASH
jgi:hypothetical protein